MRKLSRREFAKGLAIAPVALAAGNSLLGIAHSQAAPAQAANPPAQKAPKTDAQYNRHPPVIEPEPFAAPLVFARNEIKPKLQPFALREVTLEAGPLLQAREWNRGYIMRLPNDRLLHNFRVNAGLPSTAQASRRLGRAQVRASRPFCRALSFGVRPALCSHRRHSRSNPRPTNSLRGLPSARPKLNDNGYLSAFPTEFFDRLDQREKVWAPFYTMHKIMAGLST